MRRFTASLASMAVIAAVAGAIFALPAGAGSTGPTWEPSWPQYNLKVILEDVTGGSGFGVVKFRQPRDADKIVYLDTRVVGLAPNHSYLLQRAVDTMLDGNCTSTAWLTLGKGLVPQEIATDEKGNGREALFRDLAAVPEGAQFDIYFRVIDAVTAAPVLESACYQYTVRM